MIKSHFKEIGLTVPNKILVFFIYKIKLLNFTFMS